MVLVQDNDIQSINTALLAIKRLIDSLRTDFSEQASASSSESSSLAGQLSILETTVNSLAYSVSSLSSQMNNKQDKLSTAQLAAVNSGVTSSVVSQVSTNTAAIANKQDTLVSGTNIKTVNGASLLGSGDIVEASWNVTTLSTGTTSSDMAADTYSAMTPMPFTIVSQVLYIQFTLANNLVCTCYDFKFANTGNPQLKGLSVRPNVAIPSGTSYTLVGIDA